MLQTNEEQKILMHKSVGADSSIFLISHYRRDSWAIVRLELCDFLAQLSHTWAVGRDLEVTRAVGEEPCGPGSRGLSLHVQCASPVVHAFQAGV